MIASTRASTRCCLSMARACNPASARLCFSSASDALSSARLIMAPHHRFSPAQQKQPLDRPLHRGFAAAAAPADGSSPASLVDRLKSDMKDAMKARDQDRLAAIRFLSAAIKQREIEMREGGGAVDDAEVVKVIQKLVKQRKDSIESYRAGGREDLVAKEQVELKLLEGYLPAMLSAEEVEAVVVQVISELGLSGPKAMGAVMKAVMVRTGGRADNKTVSDLAKAKLKP